MINWMKNKIKINTLEIKLKALEKENIELTKKITFKDDEIELLKEQIKKLKETKKKLIDKNNEQELKMRIDKAIEYIEVITKEELSVESHNELIDILENK